MRPKQHFHQPVSSPSFIGCMSWYRKASQFLIATHSPIILAYPAATIYRLDERGISETTYESLEHVTLTRDFLNHRDRFVGRLLDEGRRRGR